MLFEGVVSRRAFALGLAILAVLGGDAWKLTARLVNDPSRALIATYLPHLHPGEKHRRGTFHLVALGDSVAAAVHCDCEGYVGIYSAWLADETHRNVETLNFGLGGKTSSDLVDDVTNDVSVRNALRKANVVLLEIGANDFDFSSYDGPSCDNLSCFADDISQLRKNLAAIGSAIKTLRQGKATFVVVTGYWAVWSDGAVGQSHGPTYMRINYSLTQHTNQVTSDFANAELFHYVDIYAPFHGPEGNRDDTVLLADDGDHPSSAGHALIASTMLNAGVPSLLP
ncbi:MAG: SGNH/GDSL hydrolase family protein [Actinomycetota bacterium]